MCSEEEMKCPLCAEEMDWTDQQLKPCESGYQVCVWCWHQIMDMAEKEEAEGRCPACRIPYNKEKVVAMELNCERLATINSNQKHKPKKAKPKTNDGRTDFSTVRVIQRKVVYVTGLPYRLADEDLLQRKEYFGQYGNVSKVCLSRKVGGAILQFVNETCGVYVTYSSEEEAIRCIQSVHGFVLDGKLLRASFGTAKYCHAWLRKMVGYMKRCTNPACFYLHKIGAEEDSFSKDDVAAVHTRNRVKQIVGATHSKQRRSGNVLPPPIDEPFRDSNISVEKFFVKSAAEDAVCATVTSSGHSICSVSCNYEDKEKKHYKMTTSVDLVGRPCSSGLGKDWDDVGDEKILNSCSRLSSATIDNNIHLEDEYSDAMPCIISSSNHLLAGLATNNEAQVYSIEPFRESSSMLAFGRADSRPSDACVMQKQSCLLLDSGRQILHGSCRDLRDDSVFFDYQRSEDSDTSSQTTCLLPSSYPVKISGHSTGHALQLKDFCSSKDFNAHVDEASMQVSCANSYSFEGHNQRKFQSFTERDEPHRRPQLFTTEEIMAHLRRFADDNTTNDDNNSIFDAIESSIISNIMSLDFDACDDSLSSPQHIPELFDETDWRFGSSWNFNNSNQSEFLFAKQGGLVSQGTNLESSLSNNDDASKKYSVPQDSVEYWCNLQQHVSRAQSLPPPGFSMPSRQPPPGFSVSERTNRVFSAASGIHSVKTSSLPNRQCHALSTGNINNTGDVDFIDPAILAAGRGKPTENSSGLIMGLACNPQLSAYEDEARHLLWMQQSTSAHHDSKFSNFFMQETPRAHQERRFFGNIWNGFSPLGDTYGISSSLVDQHQTYEPFTQMSQQKYESGNVTNSYLSTLDELQTRNEVGRAELQRNERIGFNKSFTDNGDLMLHMASSGNVYSRVRGM